MSDQPSVDLPTPERVLAIGAHPDDVEFGCGATLAKWAAAGARVTIAVLTDGSRGTWDPEADLVALAGARRAEQKRAASVLGVDEVVFLDLADGELAEGREERRRVCELVRRFRPMVILTHDPWRRYRLHPDHRHAGFLVLGAVAAAREPHAYPEQGLAPHRPERLLLFEAQEVDHVEAVDGDLDIKIEALLCHRSQWRSTMGIADGGPDAGTERAAFVDRLRAEAAVAGRPAGIGAGEGFKLMAGF